MSNSRPKILMTGAENFGRGGRSVIAWTLTDSLSQEFQVDFLSRHQIKDLSYLDKISERGAEIKVTQSDVNSKIAEVWEKLSQTRKIIANGNYDVVHINADDAWEAMKFVLISRLARIKSFVIHAHATQSARSGNILGKALNFFSKKYLLTLPELQKVACSQEAAAYLFGTEKEVTIIENGIQLEDYRFKKSIREDVRQSLNISGDTIVIGTVGRISEPKNPFFTLEIIERLIQDEGPYHFLWVGDGPLKEEIEKQAIKKKLSDSITFLGNRIDVNRLLQGFDVFILPSLHEGFGIVNIEAQVSGCPCLVSDGVPSTAKVNNNFHFLPLSLGANEWAKMIIDLSTQRLEIENLEAFRNSGFDIRRGALKLRAIYQKLLAY